MAEHMKIEELSVAEPLKKWTEERYGEKAPEIWNRTCETYNEYLQDLPDYGGRENGHGLAIYGGLLIFALYPSLPDRPPITELQDMVNRLFMGKFTALGKIFTLNRSPDMRLIDLVFAKVGRRDREDYQKWPAGFENISEPYDKKNHVSRYHFAKCPNAEFAKEHGLLHVLPLLCNSDFYGISEIHGRLIRCGTCGNSDCCDYCVMGNRNPLAAEYETVTDEGGFLVSRKKA